MHSRREGVRGYIPALSKSQAFPEEPEGGSIGIDLSGDEPVEDPSVRSESGGDSVEQDKLDNYDSENDEPPKPSDTAQNVPAAVRKL